MTTGQIALPCASVCAIMFLAGLSPGLSAASAQASCAPGTTTVTVRGKIEIETPDGSWLGAQRIRVALVNTLGKTVDSGVTSSQGMYHFTNVTCGQYKLQVWADLERPTEYPVSATRDPYTDVPRIRLRIVNSGNQLGMAKRRSR